jgi:ATP-dependent RNA helicase SUPV3L1/SUV3
MLSITGMTLEQFADLMQGLGYRAARGEPPSGARRQARRRAGRGHDRPKEGARSFEARPPTKDRIDPDNPFAAALMGLRLKD